MTTSPNVAEVDDGELPKLEAIISALKCEQTGHIMEAILLYEESIFKLSQMADAEPSRRQLCGKYLSSSPTLIHHQVTHNQPEPPASKQEHWWQHHIQTSATTVPLNRIQSRQARSYLIDNLNNEIC